MIPIHGVIILRIHVVSVILCEILLTIDLVVVHEAVDEGQGAQDLLVELTDQTVGDFLKGGVEGFLRDGPAGIAGAGFAGPARRLFRLRRGHRLVADDTVEVRRPSDRDLVGRAPGRVRHFMEIKGMNDGNLADLAEAMLATNNYAYTVESNTTFSWAELRGGSYPIGDRVTYWFLSLLIQAASPVWMAQPQDSTVFFSSREFDHRPQEPLAYTTPAVATGDPGAASRADAVDPWSAGDDPWTSARASAAMDQGDALSGWVPRWPSYDE